MGANSPLESVLKDCAHHRLFWAQKQILNEELGVYWETHLQRSGRQSWAWGAADLWLPLGPLLSELLQVEVSGQASGPPISGRCRQTSLRRGCR